MSDFTAERLLREIPLQTKPLSETGGVPNGYPVEEIIRAGKLRIAELDGELACRENQVATGNLDGALASLDLRTLKRQVQGVEGTRTNHEGADRA